MPGRHYSHVVRLRPAVGLDHVVAQGVLRRYGGDADLEGEEHGGRRSPRASRRRWGFALARPGDIQQGRVLPIRVAEHSGGAHQVLQRQCRAGPPEHITITKAFDPVDNHLGQASRVVLMPAALHLHAFFAAAAVWKSTMQIPGKKFKRLQECAVRQKIKGEEELVGEDAASEVMKGAGVGELGQGSGASGCTAGEAQAPEGRPPDLQPAGALGPAVACCRSAAAGRGSRVRRGIA